MFTPRVSKSTTFSESIRLIDLPDRRKIVAVCIFQALLGFLDLLGVAVVGILGALSVRGIQSQEPGETVSIVLSLLQIDEFSFQNQVAILGLLGATLLLGRTFFSAYFTRRMLFFLADRGAKASENLISKVMGTPLLSLQSKSSHETLWAVTNGVSTIMLGVIGSGVNMVADISLLLVICTGLLFLDPLMALGMIAIFSLTAWTLYKILSSKAQEVGRLNSELSIETNEKFLEILGTYRLASVQNRRGYYAKDIARIRYQLAGVLAENSFLPFVGKYVIETTLIISAVFLSAFQFLTTDASRAVAVLAVFMAAGSRIGPAVLRIQQGALTIKTSLSAATPTLELIRRLENSQSVHESPKLLNTEHAEFNPTVSLTNVTFKYPENNLATLQDLSVMISNGTIVAIVGPSGAGKTTLADVMLGVIQPDSGEVLINDVAPDVCIRSNPGAISYVPQDSVIIHGTIRDNVCLGFDSKAIEAELIWDALKIADLEDFVLSLPQALETVIGDGGLKISGGQKQRFGIARAVLSKPRLLILDEATSALDGETEGSISTSIQNLKGNTTVITIAHRLSTVRNADVVIYLDNGNIKAMGSFEEVRTHVPDFDRQAKIMGL